MRTTLLALCSVSGARGVATSFYSSEHAQKTISAADVSLTCDACGKNGAGIANCCSEGGAWHGNCGEGAEHTWEAGLNVCTGVVTEAAFNRTAHEQQPTAGILPDAKHRNKTYASLTCEACGENELLQLNCCSGAGAWQGRCGDGAEHSWQEGFNACIGAAAAAPDQTAPEQDPTAGSPSEYGDTRDYRLVECKHSRDCHDHDLPHCVVQADGNYAQCVSCFDDDFAHACPSWKGAFLKAAEDGCSKSCAELSKRTMADLQCNSDFDCYANTKHKTCVIQADGEFAQCISCSRAAFQSDCPAWEESKFLPSSEKACRQKCDCPKSEHTLKSCTATDTTARTSREGSMSSDENVMRSQRRRSPVLGLEAINGTSR